MLKNLFLRVKNLSQTKATKQLTLVVFVLSAVSLIVFMPAIAKAGLTDALTNVFAWILDLLMSMVGALTTLVLSVLINIAQFNEFTTSAAVTVGWVLVRDISNMFFIVILLVISVGTVLGIQSYSYKNFLKKVIIMAILINFSKTIAGFLIDVSQVIMLTFVAAFKDSISVGFTEAFGLNKLKSLATSMDASGEIEQDNFALILGMLFGLTISIILLLVLVSVVIMLAYRIVVLWILVVLSPFAYLASAMPGSLSGQAKQWWSQFTEQLIVGPAIAFFLWLTLSVVSATGGSFTSPENSPVDPPSIIGGTLASAPFLLNYFLGIMLLIVGMKMAQQMGGKSGAVMGKTFAGAKKYGWKGVRGAGRGIRASASFAFDTARNAMATTEDEDGNKIRGKEARIMNLTKTKERGGLRGLMAARALDTTKKRDKRREKWVKGKLEKYGFGESSLEAFDDMREKVKQKKINKAGKDAKFIAEERWTGNADIVDSNGKQISTDDFHAEIIKEQNEKIRIRNAEKESVAKSKAEKKANTDWKKNKDAELRKYAIAHGMTIEDVKNSEHSQIAENEYKNNIIEKSLDAVEKEDLLERNDTGIKRAGELYIAEQESKARKIADNDYKAGFLTEMNPMQIVYTVAKKETAAKQLAIRKGKIFATEPERFTALDVEDNLGDIKSKATKAIFKDMTTEQVDKLVKTVDNEVDSKVPGTDAHKKAQKKQAALYKALKHLSDEKVGNDASKYYENNLANKNVKIGKTLEQIGGVTIKKSKQDWMTDVDVTDDQIINTGYEIENEISNLKSSDLVKDAMGGAGWQVDQEATKHNENGNIVLNKGTESKEVTKDEFVRENANVLSEHFYKSDRYKRLQADQGDNYVLSEGQYKEYARISKSSQEGITTGSLSRGGNMAAVNFDELSNMVEGGISGVQRKAGMFVQGDEAVKAASAMTEMLASQISELQEAESDDDIKAAFNKFGIKPSENANLQELKQNTIAKSNQAIANLGNEEKLKSDGLIILNKSRKGREARGLIRHEKAHDVLESVDPDGAMQDEIWDRMTEEEKETAREYIRKDRNQPDISEEEIKKEYIADAFANAHKPGGPDEAKPQLPPEVVSRLKAGNNQKVSFDEKVKALKAKKASAPAEKINSTLSNIKNITQSENVSKDETLAQLEELRDSVGNSSAAQNVSENTSSNLQQQITNLMDEINNVQDINSSAGKTVVNKLNKFVNGFSESTLQEFKSNVSDVKNISSTVTIGDTVDNVKQIISNKNITSQQLGDSLRDLQNQMEVNIPEDKKASGEYDKMLEALRGSINQAESASSTMNEEQSNVIAGQVGQLLNNIPSEMLNAGKKKDNKKKKKGEINE